MNKANEISAKTRLFDFFRFFFRFPFIERLLIRLKSKSDSFAKLVPNYYQYKPKTFREFIRSGINYRVDIADWLGYCAYFNIKNDPYDSLFSLVKPGMIVFDIGSNIGFTALNIAALVGEGGMVYAFEPDAYNYTFLKNNVELNKKLHVKTFQLGVGNYAEKLKLITHNESNRGENKISSSVTSDNYIVVDIIRLDDFMTEKNISHADIIKIDTEGFEMNVLKGAKKIIEGCKPILFIEINDENLKEQKSSAKDIIAYIISIGYQITSAQTSEIVSVASDFTNCHFDAVCRSVKE